MKWLLLYLLNKIQIDKELAIKILIEIVEDTHNEADAKALQAVVRKLV